MPYSWNTFMAEYTLRASLSGTFLQTLPDLVMRLLKGALFISTRQLSCDAVTERPPKGLGTNMTVEAT